MSFYDEDVRGHLVRLDENSWVERDVLRIAEKIQAYDPNLKLQFLAGAAEANQAPYRLVERCRDGQWRPVFDIWELDDRVIDRLFNADTRRVDVLLNLNKHNAMVRRDNERRYRESMDEARDIIEHVIGSSKGRYSFDVTEKDGTRKVVSLDNDPSHRDYKVEYK